jgi:D-glycero-beta-D-manno-heptose-7-phosphate kinase
MVRPVILQKHRITSKARSMDNLTNIVKKFKNKHVLVVGDVMVDEYIWGEALRISPEAPVPIVKVYRKDRFVGGAANVAANVISLGGRALLGGVIGDDPQAQELSKSLLKQGIETNLIKDPTRPTITKVRIIAKNQQIVRVDQENVSHLNTEMEKTILKWVKAHIMKVDVLIISDYAKGVVTPRIAREIIGYARQLRKPVIIDPKENYQKYKNATVVTPNAHEACQALNQSADSYDDLVKIGQQLLSFLNIRALLITHGSEGMILLQPEGIVTHIPAIARTVYDVTGAGDTVIATFSLALAAGANFVQSAKLANIGGSIVVGKIGTATASMKEILQSL